jgi:hypothetical protein
MTEKNETWGLYPWFSENGEEWIDSKNQEQFRLLQPYGKVFQLIEKNDNWVLLKYSESEFLVKKDLFQEIPKPCFHFGQVVCEKSKSERVGEIVDITWHHEKRKEMYFLKFNGKLSKKRYFCDDLLEAI